MKKIIKTSFLLTALILVGCNLNINQSNFGSLNSNSQLNTSHIDNTENNNTNVQNSSSSFKEENNITHAEFTLKDNHTANDILNELINKGTILRFEEQLPSMNDIFLQTVSK